jgi:hypothetical protein
MPRKKKQQPVLEELDQSLEETQPQVESDELDEVDNQIQDVEKKTEEPFENDQVDEEAIKDAVMDDDEEDKKIEELARSMERRVKYETLFKYSKDARRKYDREWLSRDLFRRGYQFTSHSGGTVTLTSRANAKIPVNLTWAYIRSIKNQVTSFNPKFEVLPEFKGKQAEANARLAGKLLDYLFTKNNMNKQIKEAVIQGLMFSVGGPFEVIWDENFDNGNKQPQGEVVIRLHDPFDIYIDPNATSADDAQFIIKAVRTSLDDIKKDKIYSKTARAALVSGSPKKAESEYKQFLLQTIQNSQAQTEDNDAVILKEIQIKERNEDGDIRIRYFTWVDEVPEPLRDELVDQEDFDIEFFQADMNPLELYGESWSKHVIALNRVLNALESSIFDYNYRYAKGRLVIDKNSGVNAVTNEHGSIIEKNRGAEVKPLPLQPLPSSVENQILRIKGMMEDISGVHEATLGRVPAQVKSGIGIAELKQSDSTNQDDLVQNLEQCLMRLGRKILKKVAQNYDTPRVRRVVGNGRIVEHFAAVGESFVGDNVKEWKISSEKYPLAKISETNELKVQIGSWLAYSKEAQQKVLVDLAEAGLIDKETVLKHLEFPDVQDIVDRVRVESLIEQKRKEEPLMPMGISQEQLAIAENEMMSEGSPVIVDPDTDDHKLHIAIHTTISDEADKRLVAAHIAEHQRALKGGGQRVDQTPLEQGEQLPPIPAPPPEVIQQMNGQVPMPAQISPQGIPQQLPTPRPEASFFSAGVAELPPTSTSIVAGPANQIPLPPL